MKKSRFTESQIVAILKEGEAGVAVAQITRKHGISAATYYHWESKCSTTAAPTKRCVPCIRPSTLPEPASDRA
jgi:putative transposase